jgi:nucleoside-diphosphate-sugar epimerase
MTLADACQAIAAASEPDVVPAGVYNLGAGIPTQVRKLAELVQDRVEVRCGWRPRLVAPAATEPASDPYVIAVDRLAAFGLRGRAALADGVDEIVEQCVAHADELAGVDRTAT